MQYQVSRTAVLGIAAFTFAVASTASAQGTTTDSTRRTTSSTRVTSSQRIPVRKDASGTTTTESSGAIARPNADSLAHADSIAAADRARQDSIANVERMRQDSIANAERMRQDSIANAERMRADSIARADSLMRAAELRRRMAGAGLYFQIGGGASIPRGNFDNFFDRGYNVTGSLGWQPAVSPLGIRFDVGYDRFNSTGATGSSDKPSVWSGLAEATLKAPHWWAVQPYLIAGGGVSRFSNYGNTPTYMTSIGGTTSSGATMTKGQWNAGGGIGFGVGTARLFVESRYMHVATPNNATSFVPVIVGLSF